MKNSLISILKRFRQCDAGATLVEYGIALSLAVAVGGGALATLGGDVSGQFSAASTAINGSGTGTGTGTGG